MNSSAASGESCESCEFQENLMRLRETYFFSGLPIEALKVFAYLCSRATFKPATKLFEQGEDDGQAFFIISGKARLTYADEAGEHAIREYGAGDFLGGLVLLSPMMRLFSLETLEEVDCLIITRERFVRVLEQFPHLVSRFLKAALENIRAWEDHWLSKHPEACSVCWQSLGVTLI